MTLFPKIIAFSLTAVIASVSLGFAQGKLNQEFQNIQIDFDAGMFNDARLILEDLLNKDPPPWQAGVLQYNLGCVYLAQGDLDKAITIFSNLQSIAGLSPLLIEKFNLNLGIAHYRKAIELNLSDEKERDYPSIIYHLKQSIQSFALALKAECFIEQKIGGTESCKTSIEIQKLQNLAKVMLSEILGQSQKNKLEHISLKQGIPWLFFGMSGMIADIAFLQDTKIEEPLRKKYQDLFVKDSSEWLSIWKAVSEQSRTISDEEIKQKVRDLFGEGQSHFEQMIANLKKGEFGQSKDAAEETIKHLENLMQLAFGEDPLFVLLQNLQSQFSTILGTEELRESTWINLRSQYESIERITTESEGAKASIETSRKIFNAGYAAYKESRYIMAEFLLYSASFWIQDAILHLEEVSPIGILAGILAEQNLALRLNQFRNQLSDADITERIKKEWIDSQQTVLKRAKPFLQTVYEAQVKIFQGNGTQRCQSSPWNEVLPLYEQGFQAAKDAAEMLKGRFAQQVQAISRQESAVAAWKEALNLLLNPKPYQEGSCFSGGGQAQEPQQQSKDQEEAPKPKETSNEKVLQLLQEMDLDDKLPATEQAPIQKGLKPW